MTAAMRVIVDLDHCIGTGQCVLTAPDVFDERPEDGTALLLTDTPPADRLDAVRESARRCPAAAIRLVES